MPNETVQKRISWFSPLLMRSQCESHHLLFGIIAHDGCVHFNVCFATANYFLHLQGHNDPIMDNNQSIHLTVHLH